MSENNRLPRSSPEAQGISSAAISAFVDAADRNLDALHSFMLLRHGAVVAEGWWSPYRSELRHMLFSLSKSFASTAVGMAVAEGLLTVEDPVLSFFPDEAPADPSENLRAMRVRHLLTMSTGHDTDATGSMSRLGGDDWAKGFLAEKVEHQPGTKFVYNSGATYMLSAIVQRLTGMTLLEYLTPRLFEPLGIEDPTWESCPRGVNVGGWGLSVKTEDIARFGQLYLQKGVWNGRRILSEAWIDDATSAQVSNASGGNADWAQGYGYQFWRCRHDAYRGDGAFGQFCVMMPDQEAVLAVTSGVGNMQAVLDLAWKHLLPAMGADPLSASGATEKLQGKLAGLALPPAGGTASSPLASRVSGKTYRFEPNERGVESVAAQFDGEGASFTVLDGNGEHVAECRYDGWKVGWTTLDFGVPKPAAASGAWESEEVFALKVYYVDTPFCVTHRFRFAGDRLDYSSRINVAFGPTERPEATGRIEE
jgi:CubicO group peptidase (beta-lactamase class C family)